MKFFFLLILFSSGLFFTSQLCAQVDYTDYYNLTNKAYVAHKLGNREKVDSLFRQAFRLSVGFFPGYRLAFLNYYHLYHKIDTNFLEGAYFTGYTWKNFKYDAQELGLKDYKGLKKVYRNNKPRHQKGSLKVFGMIIRDQLSKSRHFGWLSWRNADSINVIKLKKLILKRPELFNRRKTSSFTTQLLTTLLIHQGNWKYSCTIFYKVRQFVQEGKISPFTIQNMINRSSIFYGTNFRVNSTDDSLVIDNQKLGLIVKGFHYALIEGADLYGRFSFNGKFLLPPTAPNATKNEINRLRKYLFMLPIDEAFPNKLFTHLTKKEFKKLLLQ